MLTRAQYQTSVLFFGTEMSISKTFYELIDLPVFKLHSIKEKHFGITGTAVALETVMSVSPPLYVHAETSELLVDGSP